MNYILNPDGSFMSAHEIVADLLSKTYPEDTMQAFLSDFKPPQGCDRDEAIAYVFFHQSFGRFIRNTYGLWNDKNPHIVLNPAPNAKGIIDHPLFPDNYSGDIMDKFIARLKQKHKKAGFEIV